MGCVPSLVLLEKIQMLGIRRTLTRTTYRLARGSTGNTLRKEEPNVKTQEEKCAESEEAPTIYFEIRRGDDKEQNDEEKTIHGKQLYKVAEINLSPRRWIKNLIIIYFIFDHWFGEQKLHNFLVKNLQQQ